MKKLLLSAMFMLGTFMLSAQVSNDPATYDEVDGFAIKPLWGWYLDLGNQTYGSAGSGTRGMAITKDGTQMLIPNRIAHNNIYIDVYSTTTGEKIKSVKISDDIWYRGKKTVDGVEVDNVMEFQANDIAVDDAGNVLLWKLLFNLGTGLPEVFAVDMETGNVKSVPLNSIEGAEGRFDCFGAYGDVVNGDGIIMTACNGSDEVWGTIAAKWIIKNGVLQPSTFDDLIVISEYYPQTAKSNGGPTRIKAISDDLFYLDAFSSFVTLYNMDGTMADNFGKITDPDLRAAVQPLNAGNNGFCEFSIGDKDFLTFSMCNQDKVTPMTATRLVSWDINKGFSSMSPLYTLPKDGMGNISNAERSHVPAVFIDKTTNLARIVIHCGRGGAVGYDFGTKEAMDAAYGTGIKELKNGAELIITSNNGEITLSEVGNIEVYDFQGQKVADKFLATSIRLIPGAYIVKATNGSGTVTSKVIVE